MDDKAIAITNKAVPPRPIDIHLDHDSYCGNGPCSCERTAVAKLNHEKNGDLAGHEILARRVPKVLRINHGETVSAYPWDDSPIPSKLQDTPDFKRNKAHLKVGDHTPPAPAEEEK